MGDGGANQRRVAENDPRWRGLAVIEEGDHMKPSLFWVPMKGVVDLYVRRDARVQVVVMS
eukprot:9176995-Alexandrium_andersonii.AAC.1